MKVLPVNMPKDHCLAAVAMDQDFVQLLSARCDRMVTNV